jgi:hypothetical protein
MPKMNLNHYITSNYDDKSGLLKVEKQSQTNPNEPNLYCVYSWSISKQTQSKPILLSLTACKFALSASRRAYIVLSASGRPGNDFGFAFWDGVEEFLAVTFIDDSAVQDCDDAGIGFASNQSTETLLEF